MRKATAAVLAVLTICAAMTLDLVDPDPADAAAYTLRIVNTGGDGVGARKEPRADSPRHNFPGPGEGAAVGGICQIRTGSSQASGTYSNFLWHAVEWKGVTIYVNDTWTDSPSQNSQYVSGWPVCGQQSPPPQQGPPPGGTHVSRDRQLRLCSDLNNGGCVPGGMPTVSANQAVRMVCWQKGSWDTADYRTDMWFWIAAPRGEGYVTAAVVRNQTSVPECRTIRGFVAAEAALARHGQTYASPGDRAMFGDSEWKPGPAGEWAGDCPKIPYVAWRSAGISIPKNDAIANKRTAESRNGGALPKSAPPRGAVVFWDVTSYGHEAIALGNGFVATTTGMDFDGTANTVRHYTAWPNYRGWYMP